MKQTDTVPVVRCFIILSVVFFFIWGVFAASDFFTDKALAKRNPLAGQLCTVVSISYKAEEETVLLRGEKYTQAVLLPPGHYLLSLEPGDKCVLSFSGKKITSVQKKLKREPAIADIGI